MNRILVFGSMNFDNIYSVSHITGPGETQSSRELNIRLGGKGYNQAVAARQTGADVWLAGLVGEDGGPFIEACQARGIHAEYIGMVPGCKTGHAIIQVNDAAENSILLYGGANQRLEKNYIDSVIQNFEPGDYLLLQNEVNHLDYILERAYRQGMQIVLNPSPFDEKIGSCDLTKLAWIFVNEVESKQIAGECESEVLMARLASHCGAANIVLTLGADGAVCKICDGVHVQKAFSVTPVDTTGAGDCFLGYFIGLTGKDIAPIEALRTASAAAALCITRPGAAESVPDLESVSEYLNGMR